MRCLFEPVFFQHTALAWDYKATFTHHHKGYYHWHQCSELLLIHDGQGTVTMNRQTFPISPGMLFFFSPYQLHHVFINISPEMPYTRSIFYPDTVTVERLLQPFPRKLELFTSLSGQGGHGQAFNMLPMLDSLNSAYNGYEILRQKGYGDDPEELALFMLQVTSLLSQAEIVGVANQKNPVPDQGAIGYSGAIMRWIEKHYQGQISLEQLSQETHLSQAYISRVFHRETGSSLTDYLAARRIKHACRLLERTELPVDQIGEQSGFPNVSHFIQLFKKKMGITPLQYRKSLILKE